MLPPSDTNAVQSGSKLHALQTLPRGTRAWGLSNADGEPDTPEHGGPKSSVGIRVDIKFVVSKSELDIEGRIV